MFKTHGIFIQGSGGGAPPPPPANPEDGYLRTVAQKSAANPEDGYLRTVAEKV